MIRGFTLAALFAVVSAQSLSSKCISALSAVAANSDAAACLSPTLLLPILTAGNDTSLIQPVNDWLTSLCAAPPCTNTTLAAVSTNVTTGCAEDLGASSDQNLSSVTSLVTQLVQQYYPTVRQVACLKDGNTNCVTQTLTNLQTVTGTLTISNILAFVSDTPFVPSNITCTNCIKEAYNIINKTAPSFVADAAPTIEEECGASFLDGTIPSSIIQTASNSSSTTNSSSASNSTTSGTAKSGDLGSASMLSSALAGIVASGLVAVSFFA